MPRASSVTRKHYEDGDFVAEWFNTKTEDLATKQLKRFVVGLNLATQPGSREWEPLLFGEQGPALSPAGGLTRAAITRIHTKIKYIHDATEPILSRLRLMLLPLPAGSSSRRRAALWPHKLIWRLTPPGLQDGRRALRIQAVLDTILELAHAGVLHKLGICPQCGRWRFAKSTKNRFCSTDCCQNEYASSPQGKKKHAEYMRRWRAQPSNQQSKLRAVKDDLKKAIRNKPKRRKGLE